MDRQLSYSWFLCLVLSFAATEERTIRCAQGFAALGDKCYLVSLEKTSWQDALRRCHALNANMLVFDNVIEADYLKSYLNRLGLRTDGYDQALWTGLNDVERVGSFIIERTSKPMPFNNWEVGQPQLDGTEDCVAIYGSTLRYHDYACSNKYVYVCTTPLS